VRSPDLTHAALPKQGGHLVRANAGAWARATAGAFYARLGASAPGVRLLVFSPEEMRDIACRLDVDLRNSQLRISVPKGLFLRNATDGRAKSLPLA
jgi:hypothetical protein